MEKKKIAKDEGGSEVALPFLYVWPAIAAIYINSLSTRIFMISNCYLDSEGESAWQDSPL